MRIKKVIIRRDAHSADKVIDFTDDYAGGIHREILLTGPNGCGKTTVLDCIRGMWRAAWLWSRGPSVPLRSEFHGCAVVIEGEVLGSPHGFSLGLIFGASKWVREHMNTMSDTYWMGEKVLDDKGALRVDCFDKDLLERIAKDTPSLCYVSNNMLRTEGEIEEALYTMAVNDPDLFRKVCLQFSNFLPNKDLHLGESGEVKVLSMSPSATMHNISALSTGEMQALLVVLACQAYLEEGGVLLLEEGSLGLHPSLTPSVMSYVQQACKEKGVQLICTSHNPEVWSRFELSGLRLELEQYSN